MRVLLRRHGNGIGDWLLLLQAMKHVNEQHPDVELYVDFDLPPIGQQERVLPRIVREAFERSDVVWKTPTSGVRFDRETEHVVYPRRASEPYLEGMIGQLEELIGREVHADHTVRPRFVYPECKGRPTPYVCIVSQGKLETRFKDWGTYNFELLAARCYRELGLNVVQLGAEWDIPLEPKARSSVDADVGEVRVPVERYLGYSFETLAGILAGAQCFVGLENGLAVLAGMLRVPHVVAYMREKDMGRLVSDELAALYRPNVDEVFKTVEGIIRHAD